MTDRNRTEKRAKSKMNNAIAANYVLTFSVVLVAYLPPPPHKQKETIRPRGRHRNFLLMIVSSLS